MPSDSFLRATTMTKYRSRALAPEGTKNSSLLSSQAPPDGIDPLSAWSKPIHYLRSILLFCVSKAKTPLSSQVASIVKHRHRLQSRLLLLCGIVKTLHRLLSLHHGQAHDSFFVQSITVQFPQQSKKVGRSLKDGTPAAQQNKRHQRTSVDTRTAHQQQKKQVQKSCQELLRTSPLTAQLMCHLVFMFFRGNRSVPTWWRHRRLFRLGTAAAASLWWQRRWSQFCTFVFTGVTVACLLLLHQCVQNVLIILHYF